MRGQDHLDLVKEKKELGDGDGERQRRGDYYNIA